MECSASCGPSCCGIANFVFSSFYFLILGFLGSFLAIFSLLATAAAAYGAWWTYTKAMETWHWLLARIDALEAGLKQETADRISGDALLKSLLDQETADRIQSDKLIKSLLDKETNDRIDGDKLLQALLDKEHAEHSTAEAKLNDLLAKETSDRKSDEDHLSALLDAEKKTRADEEARLNSLLSQEQSARAAAEDALKNTIQSNQASITNLQNTKQDKGFNPANAPATVDPNSDPALAAKLSQLGNCVNGYTWKRENGGYRCTGGSHFVTDAQLA